MRNLVNNYLIFNRMNEFQNKSLNKEQISFKHLYDKSNNLNVNNIIVKNDLSNTINKKSNEAKEEFCLIKKTENKLGSPKIGSGSFSPILSVINKETELNNSEVDSINPNSISGQKFHMSSNNVIRKFSANYEPIMHYYFPQNSNKNFKDHTQKSFYPIMPEENFNFQCHTNFKKRKRSSSRSFVKKIFIIGE
jgi:hypothetical protein